MGLFSIFTTALIAENVILTKFLGICSFLGTSNKEKNAIMICENLISTKGFDNCVIFVNVDSISVIVKAQELKADEIAQIQNIVSREMDAKIENIHIMKK